MKMSGHGGCFVHARLDGKFMDASIVHGCGCYFAAGCTCVLVPEISSVDMFFSIISMLIKDLIFVSTSFWAGRDQFYSDLPLVHSLGAGSVGLSFPPFIWCRNVPDGYLGGF